MTAADIHITKVKICGLRDTESALVAADAGADYLGFNFVEGVRRQLKPTEGQMVIRGFRIRGHRRPADIRPIASPLGKRTRGPGGAGRRDRDGGGPALVGLFRNQPADFVNNVARMADLDMVHLCGDEDEAYIRSMWKPVLRQVRVRTGTTAAELSALVKPHVEARRMVVLDHYDENTLGGAGLAFEWSAAEGVASLEGVLLAGGLTPENVRGAIDRLRPWGVDVSSGVETDGVKDHGKIRAFIAAAKGAR
jgi:phosphoribosylanthranilate isomerase